MSSFLFGLLGIQAWQVILAACVAAIVTVAGAVFLFRVYAKPILIIGGLVIASFAALGAGVAIKTTYDRVVAQASELADARTRADLAVATAREVQRQHDEQMRRLQALENRRNADAATTAAQTRAARQNTRTITKEFTRDPTDAVRALRARDAEHNRMLEHEAR